MRKNQLSQLSCEVRKGIRASRRRPVIRETLSRTCEAGLPDRFQSPGRKRKNQSFLRALLICICPTPPALWLGDLALAMHCWLETLGRRAQAFVFLSTGLQEASLMLEGASKGCQEREMEELSCLCFLR